LSCCAPASIAVAAADPDRSGHELLLASKVVGEGLRQTDLSVPAMHCGGCIQAIERALGALAGVEQARVNLTARRVAIRWRGETPPPLIETLAAAGYDAHLFEAGADAKDEALSALVRALAVAGFAASNIMLLSVSIWAGADSATRDLFHWLSALIALPAVAYSGRVFFGSAWGALRHGRTNMDVPISIGVLLAFGMSLYETAHDGPHAYFDAATALLFFLLIGRTLDHLMRERARTAVKGLARLGARGAAVVQPDGTQLYVPVEELASGIVIALAAGERVPVDARVVSGRSEIDCSLVTGESRPQPASEGAALQAGTLNLSGPLTIVATAAAKDSFLAEMIRMMEAAESGRSAYRRIADRAARLYAPVVHATAALTFAGWMVAGADVHDALTTAIAVLIITCPCALGLAVPMVQVMAARRLFENGIMVKDGGALERLAEIDTVVFDKTGTLTSGSPCVVSDTADPAVLAFAVAIASRSRHPYSRAIAGMGARGPLPVLDTVSEHPGLGLEARSGMATYRLGRADWALATSPGPCPADSSAVVLARNGTALACFRFDDRLRADAAAAMAELRRRGLAAEILSGDREANVRPIAIGMGVPYAARMSPAGKVEHITGAQGSGKAGASGKKVLMVGDGLNDAPALAAAHVSMAPASAADVGRNAADLVFLRDSLLAVPRAVAVAQRTRQLIRQNLILAVGYNALAVPIAVLGYATPLIAAVAMSLSSLVVIANALRVKAPSFAGRPESSAPARREAPVSLAVGRSG
jgi:Cu2+-exporting ATPase